MQDKVEASLHRLGKFVEEWAKMRHSGDEIHGLNAGSIEREAVLLSSDISLVIEAAGHREQATASLREERDALRAKFDGLLSDEVVERTAEACWQEDAIRATSKPRRVPWDECQPAEKAKWRLMARAALSSAMGEG